MSVRQPKIEINEWLSALEAAIRKVNNPDGVSVDELRDATGWSQNRAHDTLRKAIAAGKWRFVGTRTKLAINGRTAHVPVYAPIGGKRK